MYGISADFLTLSPAPRAPEAPAPVPAKGNWCWVENSLVMVKADRSFVFWNRQVVATGRDADLFTALWKAKGEYLTAPRARIALQAKSFHVLQVHISRLRSRLRDLRMPYYIPHDGRAQDGYALRKRRDE